MSGFDDSFGYGGYRKAGAEPALPVLPKELPVPPIYGPLRHILNSAPPGHITDQQPARQSIRISDSTSTVAIVNGPGSEAVVPLALFNQMLLRMERLENENELLMKVVDELNSVIERDRGTELKVFEHPDVATSTAGAVAQSESPAEADVVPPWRLKK